jgi:hypothetical protein
MTVVCCRRCAVQMATIAVLKAVRATYKRANVKVTATA